MRSVLAGRKTQARLLGSSPLRECCVGDRLWVREACVGGLSVAGQAGEVFAKIGRAEFVVFMDGWRQFRDGRGVPGKVPTSAKLEWTPAIHMPRWASRATLVVESVRCERLQAISPGDIGAEGELARFGGLHWRRRRPVRGIWLDPRRAFAAYWDATHGTPGERWVDDPEVVVLGFSALKTPAS